MLSSVHRSVGVSETDRRGSPSTLRTNRLSVLNSTRSFNSIERKSTTKLACFPEEERIGEREEKLRTPAAHGEMKGILSVRGERELPSHEDARIKHLKAELSRVKESESRMLESLMSQTKQLEETKIELEEAKLELRTLQETIRDMENPACGGSRDDVEKNHLKRSNGFDPIRAQEDIARLKNELKLALGAEEKSKKAMDDLAAALKEVAGECNLAKEKLLVAQTELVDTRAGSVYTKTTLKNTEEKLRLALEDVQRLKMEAEESALTWNTKQEGFRDCMKLFEEEIDRGNKDNARLLDEQRGLKDEVSKMRDIMKHALNEATVVKEALEIARDENSQMKDMLAEKENALQRLGQELEGIKVSEAAAVGSVEGLKNLLAATTNLEPSRNSSSFGDNYDNSALAKNAESPFPGAKEPTKAAEPWPEFSAAENHRHPGTGINEKGDVRSESLRYPSSGGIDGSVDGKRTRRFASFGGISLLGAQRAAADAGADDGFDERSTYSGVLGPGPGSPPMHGKKKPMIRKFADILRRSKSSSSKQRK